MKRLLTLLAVAASSGFLFALVGGQATAQVPMYDCVGPPADYIAAFDGVRGQAVDGAVSYTYKTVYIEFQSWLTVNDGISVPGHHSEHLHEGGCIAEGQTLDGSNAPGGARFFDAKYIFHNVINYTVNQASATVTDNAGSNQLFIASAQQVADLNAAAQGSGGLNTVTVFQSYQENAPVNNGIKELRWILNVTRNSPDALVDNWKVNGRAFFTQNYAGLVTKDPVGLGGGCHVDFVRTQSWTELAGATRYNYAGFGDSIMDGCVYPSVFTPDAMAVQKTADWTTTFRSTDGTDVGDVFVDPNFHVHPDTYAWTQSVVPHDGSSIPVTVPISTLNLAGGRHVFMVRGSEMPETIPGPKPISTAITVMPFFVPGDTQAPTTPTALAKANPQASSLVLSWAASSDNVGVAGYRVYRDGTQVADVTATQVTVSGLSAPSHLLEVEAYDAAGNVSPRASVVATRSWK